MSTLRQEFANRLNALKSTGPITPEGKAASSQNNRKLGLTAHTFTVIPGESQQEFDDYLAALTADFHRQTMIEKTLLLKMAQHYWIGQRAGRAQDRYFAAMLGVEDETFTKPFALYLRYQAHHDRAFHKCLAELQKIQTARANQQRKQEIHTIRVAKAHSGTVPRGLSPVAPPLRSKQPASAPVAAPVVETAA